MSWHCPACRSIIRRKDGESTPSVGVRYRCHICRLELQFDRERETLTVAPMDLNQSESIAESWGARNVSTPPAPVRRKDHRRQK
jgi:hypothetical protein